MKAKKTAPKYGTPDEENPEWTQADFARAVPFYEMFPHLKPKAAKTDHSKKTTHRHLHAA